MKVTMDTKMLPYIFVYLIGTLCLLYIYWLVGLSQKPNLVKVPAGMSSFKTLKLDKLSADIIALLMVSVS